MDIDILEFKKDFTNSKMGNVYVRYVDLVLKCELVYHAGNNAAWIRMPELWKTPTYKHKFAYWPTKELSDEFQKEVLKKLYEKHDLSLEKIAEAHKMRTKKKNKKKKL